MGQVEKRRMCPNCRAFITTDDKICPYCQAEVGPKAVERRRTSDAFSGLIPQARFVTLMILLINTGFYIATLIYSQRSGGGGGLDVDGRTLVEFGGKYLPGILAGQWWRLITAGFLHAGLLHYLMNSWVLFDVGAQVEENFGVGRYLVIYSVANVTGYLTSLYWSPRALSIGASAAIFGLIGAMLAMGVRDRTAYGAAVRRMYSRWIVFALVMSLLPGIDIGAHIGGLAGGFIVGFLAGTRSYSPAVERIWQLASGVAVAVTAYSFFLMFVTLTAGS
jgi:membrane associated rhomboid family serine protease